MNLTPLFYTSFQMQLSFLFQSRRFTGSVILFHAIPLNLRLLLIAYDNFSSRFSSSNCSSLTNLSGFHWTLNLFSFVSYLSGPLMSFLRSSHASLSMSFISSFFLVLVWTKSTQKHYCISRFALANESFTVCYPTVTVFLIIPYFWYTSFSFRFFYSPNSSHIQ